VTAALVLPALAWWFAARLEDRRRKTDDGGQMSEVG
jgi:hypothetical protein